MTDDFTNAPANEIDPFSYGQGDVTGQRTLIDEQAFELPTPDKGKASSELGINVPEKELQPITRIIRNTVTFPIFTPTLIFPPDRNRKSLQMAWDGTSTTNQKLQEIALVISDTADSCVLERSYLAGFVSAGFGVAGIAAFSDVTHTGAVWVMAIPGNGVINVATCTLTAMAVTI